MTTRLRLSGVVAWTLAALSIAWAQTRPQAVGSLRVLISATGTGVLAQDQLVVSVDGHAAPVTNFAPAKDQPLRYAVLVDSSGSAKKTAAFERKWSVELFQRLLRPGHTGYFGDFSNDLYLEKKPATIEKVEDDLRRVVVFGGGTAFRDSVVQAANFLIKVGNKAGDERRALFVFTDGDDNASTRSMKDAIAELQRTGVVVYCIGLAPSTKHAAEMAALSTATGGKAIMAPGGSLGSLLQLVDNQFWIAFEAPNINDRKLHSLTVSSTNKDVEISAPTQVTRF